MSGRPMRGAACVACLAAGIAVLAAAEPALAQTPPGDAPGGRRVPELIWSRTSTQDRVIVGQWTWHLSEDREGAQNDRIVAFVHRGFFVGTFETTHGPRALAVGLEREWWSARAGPLTAMLGFRTGLMYGYDHRLGWVAGALPILPFLQSILYVGAGPVAVEVDHTWVVLSVTTAIRF